jgi:hypothetical protein
MQSEDKTMTINNLQTVHLKLRRIDLCDLLMACLSVDEAVKESEPNNTKWIELHDKLFDILKEFDEKHPIE